MSRLPKDLTYQQYKEIYLTFYPNCGRSLEEYYKDLKKVTKNNPTKAEVKPLYDGFINYVEGDITKAYNEYKEKIGDKEEEEEHVDVKIEEEQICVDSHKNSEQDIEFPKSTLIVIMCICKKGKLVFPIIYVHRFTLEKNLLTDQYIHNYETPLIEIKGLDTRDRVRVILHDDEYWNPNKRGYDTKEQGIKDIQHEVESTKKYGGANLETYCITLLSSIEIEVKANPDIRKYSNYRHLESTQENIGKDISTIDLLSYFVQEEDELTELKRTLRKLNNKTKVSMINYSLYLLKHTEGYILEVLKLRVIGLVTIVTAIKNGDNTRGLNLEYIKTKIQLRISKKYNKEMIEYFYYFIYCLYYLNSFVSVY